MLGESAVQARVWRSEHAEEDQAQQPEPRAPRVPCRAYQLVALRRRVVLVARADRALVSGERHAHVARLLMRRADALRPPVEEPAPRAVSPKHTRFASETNAIKACSGAGANLRVEHDSYVAPIRPCLPPRPAPRAALTGKTPLAQFGHAVPFLSAQACARVHGARAVGVRCAGRHSR
jgi:hypothetical protein